MKRRNFFKAVAVPTVGLVGNQSFGQSSTEEAVSLDQTMREIDILPFADGVMYRENDFEIAIPMIHPASSHSLEKRYAHANVAVEEEPATFPLLPLVEGDAERVVAFNFYEPEDAEQPLFGTGENEFQALVLLPHHAEKNSLKRDNSMASNTSDGTIRQKWDKKLFRFEAHGIIHKDLNPTCVAGAKEGIWIKLDLPGIDSPNPFEWDRWRTYAEGTLALIEGKPGEYQFHWTKPKICSTGTSERNAVYNGVRKMIQDLVKDVLGAVGKYLDELLRLSTTIAAFIADTLTKWIRSTPQPPVVQPPPQQQQPQSFTLRATPAVASVRRGATASYNIQVGGENGFNGRVSLSAQGNTNSSVSFSPSSVTAGGAATFRVRTTKSSRVGTHTITITGVSGSLRKQIPISITIQA